MQCHCELLTAHACRSRKKKVGQLRPQQFSFHFLPKKKSNRIVVFQRLPWFSEESVVFDTDFSDLGGTLLFGGLLEEEQYSI